MLKDFKIYLPCTLPCFQSLAKNVFHQNESISQEELGDAGEGKSQGDSCATGLEKKPVQTGGQCWGGGGEGDRD